MLLFRSSMLTRFLSLLICALIFGACDVVNDPEVTDAGPPVGSRFVYHASANGHLDTISAEVIARGQDIGGKKGVAKLEFDVGETWYIANEANGDIAMASVQGNEAPLWWILPIKSKATTNALREIRDVSTGYYETDHSFSYLGHEQFAVKGETLTGTRINVDRTDRLYDNNGTLIETDTFRSVYTWSEDLDMMVRWIAPDGTFDYHLIEYDIK
jgi:hypothetical protein